MSRRQVVPAPLGRQVRQQLRRCSPSTGDIHAYGSGRATPCRTWSWGRAARDRGAVGLAVGSGTGGTVLAVVRLTAALALLAATAPPGALAAPAQAAEDDRSRSRSALSNEVDSFNPFLGIEAASYEMWALTYDYLDRLLDGGHVARAGAGHRVGDLRGRADLDLHHPRRRDVVRRRAADRRRRRLHLQPDPRRRAEATTWSSYLIGVESVEAPDDTTVVLTLKKPNAVLPLLPIPIVPEHIWKDVSEKDVKSYANEPTDGQPVVGSGPFRLVEGTPAARRTGSRPTPTTGAARRTSTRSSSASTRARTRWCRR